MCIYIYTHTHTYIYTHTHRCLHIYIHVYFHTYIYMYICVHVCVWQTFCLFSIISQCLDIIGAQKMPILSHESINTFFFFLIIYFYLFIYLWLCWVFVSVRGLSPAAASGGSLFIAMRGPLTIMASLVAEHRLQTRRLSNCGSRA